MHKPHNPLRTAAIVWWVITALAVCGVIAPFVLNINRTGAGSGIAVTCLLVTIAGAIMTIIAGQEAAALDKILASHKLLARWSYPPGEWAAFAGAENRRERSVRQKPFIAATVILLLISGIFAAIDRTGTGLWVLAIAGAVIAIIAFWAYFMPWYSLRQGLGHPGEAFIAHNGVYIGRRLHLWDHLGAGLVRLDMKEGDQPYIEFIYEEPTDPGMRKCQVRVPVPRGREEEARELVKKFSTQLQT